VSIAGWRAADPRSFLALAIGVAVLFLGRGSGAAQVDAGRLEHLIIIYQENHSFDSYFGTFPGADGLANAGDTALQVDRGGKPYATLPPVPGDPRFPPNLPNRPFLFNQYAGLDALTPSPAHEFYRQQYQINRGRMNRFVALSGVGAAAVGYWDASDLPLWQLASRYTLADHFFQAAFGGSFLNHQWLICACTPVFRDAPKELVSAPSPDDPSLMEDNVVTPDGFVVNTAYSANGPRPADVPLVEAVPGQTAPTVGDRLNEAGVDWAWYAGGWNEALAGRAPTGWGYHHQPFAYYANYAEGTVLRQRHLKDEAEFFSALRDATLPAVSFVKPSHVVNEHPRFSSVARGQQHLMELVQAIQESDYWASAAIVITYDENGGYWDHVAPPVVDRWGPGTRVPAVVVSPFAKKGYVDHTTYDTTSILKLIENRWNLPPLSSRDAASRGLENAFDVEVSAGGAARRSPQALGLLTALALVWIGCNWPRERRIR
jgi:phospholipase C